MAQFLGRVPLLKRPPRMGPDGTVRLRTDRDPELDQAGCSRIDGAGFIAATRKLLMGLVYVCEGILEVAIDAGQVLHDGFLLQAVAVGHPPVENATPLISGHAQASVSLFRPA